MMITVLTMKTFLHTESVSVQVDFSQSDDGSYSGQDENSEILEAAAILDPAAIVISVPQPDDSPQNVHRLETDFCAANNNEQLQEFNHPTGLLFDQECMTIFEIYRRLLGLDCAFNLKLVRPIDMHSRTQKKLKGY